MEQMFLSSRLKKTLDSKGWGLYDASVFPSEGEFSWEDFNRLVAVHTYAISDGEAIREYMFLPLPKPGETLAQAYASATGLLPSLRLDPTDDRVADTELSGKGRIFFTHILFFDQYASLVLPKGPYSDDTQVTQIGYRSLVDMFMRYFEVVRADADVQPADKATKR